MLTWSMICESDAKNPAKYPKLTGVKAAQARHLVGPVRALCERYRPDTLSEHRLRVLVLCERFYKIMDAHGPSMPRAASRELLQCVEDCLVHYVHLARCAAASGVKLWLVVPKHHYWWHMAFFAKFSNPRFGWTYGDEDFVGRIAGIAKSVVPGVGGLLLGRFLVYKYLRVLAIRFHRRRRQL